MLDQNCAQLVPVEIDAIANAFERYYVDSNLREMHGKKTLQRAIRFSSEEMARQYVRIYKKMQNKMR